jgi:hypothetical protein
MGNVAPDFEAFIKNGQDAQKAIDVTIQFEDRMKKKEEAESKQEEIDAEKKRQDYLTRTGRTEMKP